MTDTSNTKPAPWPGPLGVMLPPESVETKTDTSKEGTWRQAACLIREAGGGVIHNMSDVTDLAAWLHDSPEPSEVLIPTDTAGDDESVSEAPPSAGETAYRPMYRIPRAGRSAEYAYRDGDQIVWLTSLEVRDRGFGPDDLVYQQR